MAINQDIVDRYTEYRSWLIRYENRVAADVLEIMRRGEEQSLGAIVSAYEDALKASGGNLTSWDGYGIGFRRKAYKRVRAALGDVFPEARQSLRKALEGLQEDVQAEFVATLEESLPAPVIDELELSRVPERQLATMLDNQFGDRLEGSAKRAADALQGIEEGTLRRISGVMEDGVRDGVGIRRMQQMARKVVGDDLKRQVSTYVRTMVQTSANDVAGQLHRENADIVRAEQYVATLDNNTCPICGPLDGTTYRIDGKTPVPRPPRHPNCRCFMTPVLKDWKAMGLPESTDPRLKRLLDGKPADRTSWSDWVQKNPQRLERVLGPSRADLVRSGQVTLKDLATTTDVIPLTSEDPDVQTLADVMRRESRRAA